VVPYFKSQSDLAKLEEKRRKRVNFFLGHQLVVPLTSQLFQLLWNQHAINCIYQRDYKFDSKIMVEFVGDTVTS